MKESKKDNKNLFQKEYVQVMGVLNVTPDSFSDGGKYNTLEAAIKYAKQMIDNGVDIIDIGGQSTRPGYCEVSISEELQRVLPVIKALRKFAPKMPISIDTYFFEVAKKAVAAGANIINDIHGFRDVRMFEILQEFPKTHAVIMHGHRKKTVSLEKEIREFYESKIFQCLKRKISLSRICFDPGVGWKNKEETMDILRYSDRYAYPLIPLLIGISRKRIIGSLTKEEEIQNRDLGTIISSLYLANTGYVNILRVHDVKGMKQALSVWEQLTKK
ncbi:MAG: dihydropteroate synthase [Streptococcaceae bacterium]|nr:dihydropteroate synthase [Streptococcaceae bacterium]